MKKKSNTPKFAQNLTNGMATWKFVIGFLLFCIAWMEWTNHAPVHFRFDNGSYMHLNLVLSLIAAIQGAVIMIYQKYQDHDRDKLNHRIDRLEHENRRLIKEVLDEVKKK